MYKSKHVKPSGRLKRTAFLAVLIILTITVTVGGTVAFLFTKTGSILNIFNPSKVTTEVVEDTTAGSVSIKNTGDTDAYIRAAVIVTWQDVGGYVHSQAPEFTLSGTDSNWFMGADGYYYYKFSVAPEGVTNPLFTSVSTDDAAPGDEYKLHVEVLGSGIQSTPDYVVQNNWGVTVSEGALSQ